MTETRLTYVVVEDAKCLYKPNANAAVKMKPPYGSQVELVRIVDAWALIRVFGKEAWTPIENLSDDPDERRESQAVGVEPEASSRTANYQRYAMPPVIEYGPRGGRYVRTSSGFKRYL